MGKLEFITTDLYGFNTHLMHVFSGFIFLTWSPEGWLLLKVRCWLLVCDPICFTLTDLHLAMQLFGSWVDINTAALILVTCQSTQLYKTFRYEKINTGNEKLMKILKTCATWNFPWPWRCKNTNAKRIYYRSTGVLVITLMFTIFYILYEGKFYQKRVQFFFLSVEW